MKAERFKNYDNEVRELVLAFENMRNMDMQRFFDVDQLEIIIDYYLEQMDVELLQYAVSYAEDLFPSNFEIRLRRAHMLCVQNDFKQALSLLNQLQEIDPDNTDVAYAMATVFSALDQPQRAIQCYLRAATDKFELGMIYGNIADEYVNLNDDAQAVHYYIKSLTENPNDERSVENLFFSFNAMLIKELNADHVIDFYIQFVKDHPYSLKGWFFLGSSYELLGLWEKAVDAFEFVIAIDSKYVDAYLQMSNCYMNMGNVDKAVAIIQEAIEKNGKNEMLCIHLASVYLESNNPYTAISYIKKAIDISPRNVLSWIILAESYDQLGDYSSAVFAIEQAQSIDPSTVAIASSAPEIYLHYGDGEKAETMYLESIKASSLKMGPILNYVDFLIERQRYDDAIEYLVLTLLNTDTPLPYNLKLAKCYFDTGRRNMLFNILRACKSDPGFSVDELFDMSPAMKDDLEIVEILSSDDFCD